MFRRRLRKESGYTLVEVMVSIMILAIAILPMAGMFDMGLNAATAGSNYDKARALANLKLEEAKSLPFATVKDNFPQAGNTTPYDDSSLWLDGPGGPGGDFGSLQYRVKKQFMNRPTEAVPNFSTSGGATSLIRVTVIVRWGDGNTYTTYGLVTA